MEIVWNNWLFQLVDAYQSKFFAVVLFVKKTKQNFIQMKCLEYLKHILSSIHAFLNKSKNLNIEC